MAKEEGIWVSPGSREFEAASLVHQVLNRAAEMINYDSRAIAAGFISFMAPGWASMSDGDFESDLAELSKGLRLQRAHIQSLGARRS